jgi:hypothetical protein
MRHRSSSRWRRHSCLCKRPGRPFNVLRKPVGHCLRVASAALWSAVIRQPPDRQAERGTAFKGTSSQKRRRAGYRLPRALQSTPFWSAVTAKGRHSFSQVRATACGRHASISRLGEGRGEVDVNALWQGPSDAEASIADPVVRRGVVPIRRTATIRAVDPTPAPSHAERPRCRTQRISLCSRIRPTPVQTPLPDIPVRIIQTPGVGRISAHFCRTIHSRTTR